MVLIISRQILTNSILFKGAISLFNNLYKRSISLPGLRIDTPLVDFIFAISLLYFHYIIISTIIYTIFSSKNSLNLFTFVPCFGAKYAVIQIHSLSYQPSKKHRSSPILAELLKETSVSKQSGEELSDTRLDPMKHP